MARVKPHPFEILTPIGYRRNGQPIWPIRGAAEQVFNTAQLGRQAGTFYAVGAAVAGNVLYPVMEPIVIELDRASTYPPEDYGNNFDAHAGRGHHGNRGANFPFSSVMRFGDLMDPLEMHYAGDVVPTGSGPYVWVYPFEIGAPTLIPYSVRSGSETSQDQWVAVGTLLDELTMGFDDLDAPGEHPWTIEGTGIAVDREASALTPGLNAPPAADLETMMGHLSVIKLGSTSTAFASLSEIASSLVSCQIQTQRHLVLRPYGSTSDLAAGFGFSAKSEGEMTFKVKVSATTKTDLHDAWNSSGAALGEKRCRISVDGSGNHEAHFDARIGLTAVPVGERDGERVFECTGKLVVDDVLEAPAQWSITNNQSQLPSVSGGS